MDVFSWHDGSIEFFEALDDSQFFVHRSLRVVESLGVLLPGDSPCGRGVLAANPTFFGTPTSWTLTPSDR